MKANAMKKSRQGIENVRGRKEREREGGRGIEIERGRERERERERDVPGMLALVKCNFLLFANAMAHAVLSEHITASFCLLSSGIMGSG